MHILQDVFFNHLPPGRFSAFYGLLYFMPYFILFEGLHQFLSHHTGGERLNCPGSC